MMASARLWAVVALLLGAASVAHAETEGARCIVRIIHAIDAGTAGATTDVKIDSKIDRLRPYLLKPPFTAWREFVLLDRHSVDLEIKVPQKFPLPNGKTATLTFVEHLPATDGKHHRVRMQLQIDGPHPLDTVFVVHEGGVVLQAGQRFQNGLLVLATSCDQAHDRAAP